LISATSSPLGGPSTASASTPGGVHSISQPVSYDCALSLVADLVMSRATMSDELRRKFSWVTGPRVKSNQFSGLECILSGPAPLFIAPTVANLENADPAQILGNSEDDSAKSSNLQGEKASDRQKETTDSSNKDKKMTRKNKKAAFAAQNRIGGDAPDSY
jgi:hypothetical protein